MFFIDFIRILTAHFSARMALAMVLLTDHLPRFRAHMALASVLMQPVCFYIGFIRHMNVLH